MAWKQKIFQIIRDADQKNLEIMKNVLKMMLHHNKHGKCVKLLCVFCYCIGTMDEQHFKWQQLGDIRS